MNIDFTKEEMGGLVFAAREATIRFKRARTEFRKGNEAYSQWTEEALGVKIEDYTRMERSLKVKYEEAFGEEW